MLPQLFLGLSKYRNLLAVKIMVAFWMKRNFLTKQLQKTGQSCRGSLASLRDDIFSWVIERKAETAVCFKKY